MLRILPVGSIAVLITALAFSGRGSVPPAPSALALAPSLSVSECVQADPGDTLEVEITLSGVSNLMAWDIYYAYDHDILEVVDKHVRDFQSRELFLSREPNSNVFDFSDPVPNTTGLYRVAAADTGGPRAAEAGGGVLAVLTLRARDEGISWSSLAPGDVNNDGQPDYGPTLTETGGKHIGDADGDGIFDGSIRAGQIAIGRPCREPAPTPHVDPDVLPVEATVSTPAVSNPTAGPEGSNAETATPGPSASPAGPGQRSQTPGTRTVLETGSGGDSGGGLSPVLATVLGAGGGAVIIASYVFFRAVRRPA